MNADGTGLANVTNNPALDANPDWQPADIVAPETAIDSGPSGSTPDATPTFAFSSSEPGSSFSCKVDAGAFGSCTSAHTTSTLTDGPHTFEVGAIDAAGNIDPTPASRSFTVLDTTAPQTTISSGPSGGTTDPTPTFAFSANEAGSTLKCRLDGGSFGTCSSPFTTPHLEDGAHTFEVRATDPAGNTDSSPASRTFSVDAPPDTLITSGPPSLAQTTAASFQFRSTQPGSTFKCRKDDGLPSPCVSPWSVSGLAEGSHSFEVTATDATGNADQTPAVMFWTVDTASINHAPPQTSTAPRLPGPATAPPVLDRTPPTLSMLVKNARRVLKKRGVIVEVTCPKEPCTVNAAGRILIPRTARSFKLRSTSTQIAQGSTARLKLRFSKRMLTTMRHALRTRKTIRMQIVATAKDVAGNVATGHRTIRLRS